MSGTLRDWAPLDGSCRSGRSAADALRHQAPPMPLERPEIHQAPPASGWVSGRCRYAARRSSADADRSMPAPRRDQPLVVNEEPSRHDRGGEAHSTSRSPTESVAQGDERRRMTAADTCGHASNGSAVQNWASPGVRNLIRSTQRGAVCRTWSRSVLWISEHPRALTSPVSSRPIAVPEVRRPTNVVELFEFSRKRFPRDGQDLDRRQTLLPNRFR